MKNEWIEDVEVRISDKSNVILKVFYSESRLQEVYDEDIKLFLQQSKKIKLLCDNSCHKYIELNDGNRVEYVRAESMNVTGRRFKSVHQYYT